jgi:hypothetical protein
MFWVDMVDSEQAKRRDSCRCSSGVEHFLGKEEVVSSNLINGSNDVAIESFDLKLICSGSNFHLSHYHINKLSFKNF